MKARLHPCPVVLAAVLGTSAAGAAAADIDFHKQFRNVSFRQTGNATLVDNGAFFSVGATVNTAANGAYADGQLSFSDPASPDTLG